MLVFNEEAALDVETAKQDKIVIKLGPWNIDGSAYGSRAISHYLDQLPSLRVQLYDNPEDLRWFQARQRNQLQYIDFRGRGFGGRVDEGAPLISGRISAIRPTGSENANGRFMVFANLTMNPTRFARHHAGRISNALFAEEPIPNDVTLLQTRQINQSNPITGEMSLDNRDNVLLTQRARAIAGSDRWLRLVHYYFGNIINFLDRSLEAAGGADEIAVTRSGEWEINIKEVETYWELVSEDAVSALTAVLPSLRIFGSQNRVDTYPNLTEERNDNSPSVKFQLRGGVTGKLYAKTNKRIRLEITHDISEYPAVLNNGQRTSRSVDDFFYWLNDCALDAKNRGNSILEYITAQNWQMANQRPLYQLLARVVGACGNRQEQYDLVLSMLVNNGCIVAPNGSPLRAIVNSLRSSNVIAPTPRYSRTYSITSEYRSALEQLRTNSEI